jgi:hypothetical protein
LAQQSAMSTGAHQRRERTAHGRAGRRCARRGMADARRGVRTCSSPRTREWSPWSAAATSARRRLPSRWYCAR